MVTTQYPTAIPTTNQCPTNLINFVTDVLVAQHNPPHAEIIAIAAELGTLPKGAYASVKARLDALVNTISSTPIFWNMWTAAPDITGQGTWVRIISANVPYGGFFYNSSGVNGDNITCKFKCPAGTYTLRYNVRRDPNGGKVAVDFDASEEDNYDTYKAGAPDWLNIREVTGIVLSGGEHNLKFRLDGQNPSSGGYLCVMAGGIWLQRTA